MSELKIQPFTNLSPEKIREIIRRKIEEISFDNTFTVVIFKEICDERILLSDCDLDDLDLVDIMLEIESITNKPLPEHIRFINIYKDTVEHFINWILKNLK